MARGGCNVRLWHDKISMKNSKCATSQFSKKDGRPNRSGKLNKKKREHAEESKKRKEPESRTTIDMKIRTVPNVTSATRCYAIPLGENAKPFQNGMTGSPKTYKQ